MMSTTEISTNHHARAESTRRYQTDRKRSRSAKAETQRRRQVRALKTSGYGVSR